MGFTPHIGFQYASGDSDADDDGAAGEDADERALAPSLHHN